MRSSICSIVHGAYNDDDNSNNNDNDDRQLTTDDDDDDDDCNDGRLKKWPIMDISLLALSIVHSVLEQIIICLHWVVVVYNGNILLPLSIVVHVVYNRQYFACNEHCSICSL